MRFEKKWYGMIVVRLEARAQGFSQTLGEDYFEDDSDIAFRRAVLEEFENYVGVLENIEAVDERHRGRVREALERCVRSFGDQEYTQRAVYAITRVLGIYKNH